VFQGDVAGKQEHITNRVQERTKQGEQSCNTKREKNLFHRVLSCGGKAI
jgi:hypothetical protein